MNLVSNLLIKIDILRHSIPRIPALSVIDYHSSIKGKLPAELKKRFYIITFLVLPILFLIGFFVSTKIAIILNYRVDAQGIIIVIISFIPLYLICILAVYRKLLKLNSKASKSGLDS